MLDKFAYIAYVTHFILRDSDVTQRILPRIKGAIEKYALNQQKKPLVYDESWKGLISSGKPEEDFGNSNYNDHHFHYGYHVHAIALIASIDPGWLDENDSLVRNYVVTLVREYANHSAHDPYFPQSRNFDWYHATRLPMEFSLVVTEKTRNLLPKIIILFTHCVFWVRFLEMRN